MLHFGVALFDHRALQVTFLGSVLVNFAITFLESLFTVACNVENRRTARKVRSSVIKQRFNFASGMGSPRLLKAKRVIKD